MMLRSIWVFLFIAICVAECQRRSSGRRSRSGRWSRDPSIYDLAKPFYEEFMRRYNSDDSSEESDEDNPPSQGRATSSDKSTRRTNSNNQSSRSTSSYANDSSTRRRNGDSDLNRRRGPSDATSRKRPNEVTRGRRRNITQNESSKRQRPNQEENPKPEDLDDAHLWAIQEPAAVPQEASPSTSDADYGEDYHW